MNARKVILCPAAHVDAQNNFARTVQHGESLSSLPKSIVNDLPKRVGKDAGTAQLRAWGVSSRHLNNWKKIQQNDLLLFVRNKAIFGSAICTGTIDSLELAKALWSNPDWRLVILVAPPQLLNIPVTKLSAAIGYSPKFNVQRFTVLREDQSANAVDALLNLDLSVNVR